MNSLASFLLLLMLSTPDEADYRVKHDFALLHAGPEYSTSIIGELEKSSKVTVDRQEGDWLHVAGRGWIHSSFLDPMASGGTGRASETPPEAIAGGKPSAVPPAPSINSSPGICKSSWSRPTSFALSQPASR